MLAWIAKLRLEIEGVARARHLRHCRALAVYSGGLCHWHERSTVSPFTSKASMPQMQRPSQYSCYCKEPLVRDAELLCLARTMAWLLLPAVGPAYKLRAPEQSEPEYRSVAGTGKHSLSTENGKCVCVAKLQEAVLVF